MQKPEVVMTFFDFASKFFLIFSHTFVNASSVDLVWWSGYDIYIDSWKKASTRALSIGKEYCSG